ncbi:MAG TPA: SIMPL domain-containing protein [Dehalococcoidia bacterium]|nr:SIMPL domain-containing protein [Dehalococcoidia bacterium]
MDQRRLAAIAVLGAASILAFGAATCGSFGPQTTVQNDANGVHGITVSGEGKVQAKPDVAQLALGVSVLRDTVAQARTDAATSMSAITDAVKADGVADKDIQTQQFNISPEYDYSNNRQTLKGFRVTNTVSVKVRSIDNTSKVVDDAVTAGGDDTQIQGIMFTIDNPADLKTQARKQAVDDAKSKAQTLASASGVGLGQAIDIAESGGVQPIPYAADQLKSAAGAAAPATPIEPGQVDVTVDVTITWGIQ